MPTDEQLNAPGEIRARKLKAKAALAPPVIEPPQMADWGAVYDTPQPAQGPPTPGQAQDARARQISVQDVTRIRAMERLRSRLNHPGAIPGANLEQDAAEFAALRDQRARGGDEYAAIRASQAPVQKVQTPGEVVAGRAGINDQLQAALRARMIADARARGETPDPEKVLADSAAQANAALPNYMGGTGAAQGLEDPRVAKVLAGQRTLAANQERTRGIQADAAATLTGKNLAADQLDTEMGTARAGIARAAMARRLAEEQGGAEMARIQPSLAVTQAQIEQAKLKKELARTQRWGATPEDAQASMDQRRAAYAMAGLDSPEAVQAFHAQATNEITSSDSNTFLARTLPKLQDIAATDPAEAARIARDWLVSLDQQEGGFLDAASITNPGIAAFTTGKKTARMVMRAKLKEIAGAT